jgi:nucleolar protein 56
LREWYSYYNPEFSRTIEAHEKFTELILKRSREELLAEIRVKPEDAMGGIVGREDLDGMMSLASEVDRLYKLRLAQEQYIENEMKRLCPNVTAVAGSLVGAKLLSHAGSLRRLASMTSSTIQILGAEKALFRHMKFKAKAPKHGVILMHPLVQSAINRGRASRALSDKIAIAAKIDYFKGEYAGDKLRAELEMKLQ